jgi:hypothetical protein
MLSAFWLYLHWELDDRKSVSANPTFFGSEIENLF